MPSANESAETGFALLSAVVALSILLLLAAGMGVLSHGTAIESADEFNQSHADSLADAIIIEIALALQDARTERRPRVDGAASSWIVTGRTVRISVQCAFGLLDLNAAPAYRLSILFQSAHKTSVQADWLGHRVEVWRNEVPADASADSTAAVPVRRRFRAVSELLLVPGIDRELFAEVEPDLTIYSGHDSVETDIAPATVLSAIGNITAEQANKVVDERTTLLVRRELPSAFLGGKVQGGIDQRGWPFVLTADFFVGMNLYRAEAVIRLTGERKRGFVTLWQEVTQIDHRLRIGSAY